MARTIIPELSEESFDKLVSQYIRENRVFMVQRKREMRTVRVNGKKNYRYHQPNMNLHDSNSKSAMYYNLSVISRVKNDMTKYLKSVNCEYEVVRQRHNAVHKNEEAWGDLLLGGYFYEVDIKHCFWRIAFQRKYIADKLYTEVLGKGDDLKVFRNMALACVKAPTVMEYYGPWGIFEIEEDTIPYCTLYDNIRFTSYNMIGDAMIAVGERNVLSYNIDGMFCLPEVVDQVKAAMQRHGMLVEVNRCQKVGDRKFKVWEDYDNNIFEIKDL